MYTCIVIDDESAAIAGLKSFIAEVPELVLVASFTNPLQALREITAGQVVDLVLLDVDMPGLSGLELAKEIRNKAKKIVFTTAHSKYAYEAFELNADAFLLKPFSLAKFLVCFNKLFPKVDVVSDTAITPNDYFFVRSKDEHFKQVRLVYADIITVESKKNNVLITTLDKKVQTYVSLAEMLLVLGKKDFMQVHRSFIVGKAHIDQVDGNCLKMVGGAEIVVGESYRKEFQSFLAEKVVKGAR